MATTTKQQRNTIQKETVSVAHAKANFSSLITRVEQKHNPVTILRRGVPVAQIIPFPQAESPKFIGSMLGKGKELGDIVSPLDVDWTPGEWPAADPDSDDQD